MVRGQRRSAQNLLVAALVLVMLLVFWTELATGAASCFGGVAGGPPPGVEVPGADDPADAADEPAPTPRVRVKSVPKGSL